MVPVPVGFWVEPADTAAVARPSCLLLIFSRRNVQSGARSRDGPEVHNVASTPHSRAPGVTPAPHPCELQLILVFPENSVVPAVAGVDSQFSLTVSTSSVHNETLGSHGGGYVNRRVLATKSGEAIPDQIQYHASDVWDSQLPIERRSCHRQRLQFGGVRLHQIARRAPADRLALRPRPTTASRLRRRRRTPPAGRVRRSESASSRVLVVRASCRELHEAKAKAAVVPAYRVAMSSVRAAAISASGLLMVGF